MADATIWKGEAFEDSGVAIMARVVGNDGENLTQAGVTGITFQVFKLPSTTATVTGTLTVAAVMFDTLQTDSRWGEDETGYNFRYDVPAATLAEGGEVYQFEVLFNPANGEDFFVLGQVSTKKVLTS